MKIQSEIVRYFTILLLLLCVLPLSAQKSAMKFGKIGAEFMSMNHYEADSSAHALILGDVASYIIRYDAHNGFQLYYTRHLRVKIFHSMAFDEGDFKIQLWGSEKLSSLRGCTYTMENNKMVQTKFKRSDVYVEEISDNARSLNFSMPNLKEGCIFEVSYSIISPYLFVLPTWYFQGAYPILLSELTTSVPEYFFYKMMMQGFVPITKRETNVFRQKIGSIDFDQRTTIFRFENVPAFRTEPYMNARINYVTKIQHELASVNFPFAINKDFSSSWPKINKELLDSESFGKQLNRSNFLNDQVKSIQESTSDPVSQMIQAHQLIRDQMTWNRSNTIYINRSLRRAWNEKSGNSADINMLLVLLLKELNIEVYPVILSTRNNGMVNPSQIMLKQFNYVVAYAVIGDRTYLLDATDKNLPYYLLPDKCINGEGRLISEAGGTWVNLHAVKDNSTITQSNLRIQPCGSINATMIRSMQNYPRAKMSDKLRSFANVDEYMEKFETENQGVHLLSFEVENQEDWSNAMICKYEFEIKDFDESAKEILYINPLLFDKMDANPFRLEAREFPVDFIYPFQTSFNITIEIPEGYALESLPSNTTINLPGNNGTFGYQFTVNENTIEVNLNMSIAKPMFLVNEYRSLRDFYARKVNGQAQMIVLKKI
jgi:hypothetical protein